MKKKKLSVILQMISMLIILMTICKAEIDENEKRYFRVGSLQSQISAYGSERAWNNTWYEGLRWPADYLKQDNSVIKRAWITCKDFTDSKGRYFDSWAMSIVSAWAREALWPVSLKQIARFEAPSVFVDGNNVTAAFASDVDEIDATQIADRVIINVVNTAAGITMTQKVYVFSHPFHDNYFIKEYTYTNTGYTSYEPVQVLNDTVRDFRVGWGTRYQCGREGAEVNDGQQTWGKFSWVTVRGEDYPAHAAQTLTEADGPVDWLRGVFSWFGQSERVTTYDNIGGPYLTKGGRLASPQFVGTTILHVDKSATDKSDDIHQPTVLGWHAGDTYPGLNDLSLSDMGKMGQIYDMLSGIPYGNGMGGTSSLLTGDQSGRMWEIATGSDILNQKCPYTVHGDGGGTNQWICYGPWDLAPGESVTIVEAEAVNGISRPVCEEVGYNWKKSKDNPGNSYNVTWPDGSTAAIKYTDKSADRYKNEWFYTGMDSLKLTFSRAKRNYDAGFNIPQPPQPPLFLNVESGGDRIKLTWGASPSEDNADFEGYRIYRAVGKSDTVFQMLTEVLKGTYEFNDLSAVRGYSHFYHITAFNDGSTNSSRIYQPAGKLESGRFYTRTTEPAYLQRPQGRSLKDIRIVPNPYNLKASSLQFPNQIDKIMFYNIPGQCVIKIYTERGDLIQTIHHTNGSGDEPWNLITSSRQVVVSGVYIAYIEVTNDIVDLNTGEQLFKKGDHTTRKILVIR